ncbi:MAG: rhodanese-like domain-containing protein [Desulfatibacillum sp.]|nr:rhodanese-like domain-containing protein [Desulfatibacillum sp.]
MKRIVLWVMLMVYIFPFSSLAMERFDIVTTEEMHAMLKDREEGKMDFLLVNALDELLFRNEAIPGSINVPWANTEGAVHRLGDNKDRPIVIYCKGYR